MMTRFQRKLSRLFNPPPVVSVLRLAGAIGATGRFSRGLDDQSIAPLIERAFSPSRLAAVALAINSPGGAPTQSALIAARIRDAAKEKKVPVIAFCEDVAASGGYMLACAADEIFVEKNSIIGSIGVVSSSFGFHEAINRLGIERRLRTAGDNKARLDPFKPEKPEDVEWLNGLMARLHENFIAFVKSARGDRLGDEPFEHLFSGDVWIGDDGVRVGLADGVGRLAPVMKERFGDKVAFKVVTQRKGFLSMLGPTSNRETYVKNSFPADAVGIFIEEIEHRALWGRFGL